MTLVDALPSDENGTRSAQKIVPHRAKDVDRLSR